MSELRGVLRSFSGSQPLLENPLTSFGIRLPDPFSMPCGPPPFGYSRWGGASHTNISYIAERAMFVA
jgi:hypothetical protein